MSVELTKEEKEQIKKQNLEKGYRQDNKQHCQKILEGINKFDSSTASRAIWELMQNARDLSENAEVEFILDQDKLSFSHKGKPFNYETFTSLIKQVSSSEKEDFDSAGQFGTGFMTTHKFSRLIKISGSLEIAEGYYAEIKDFELNRTAKDIQQMIDAMTEQLLFVDSLVETELRNTPEPKTTFIYELDSEHFSAAEQGINEALPLIPYVMAFNKRIAKISIIDKISNRQETFLKGETKCIDEDVQLYCIDIHKNTEVQKIFYLRSKDGKDMIVLPLCFQSKAMEIDNIPRLFIYFPLLGTHNFGVNYIFHSERFYPEEPRNAIVLPDNNIDKRENYSSNTKVFYELRQMLYVYLAKYISSIEKSYLLASISINLSLFEQSDDKTKEFYCNLKREFVDTFLKLPFISIKGENITINQSDKVRFFSYEIVEFLKKEEGEKYLDIVYFYANQVSTLPAKEEVLRWSEIVGQWEIGNNHFITIEDIVNKITTEIDKNNLLDFLNFLKDSGQNFYFLQKPLIPNREGILKKAGELRNAEEIPSILYNICKGLIPDDTSKFVDSKYINIYEFTKYGRNDLKKSINDFVNTEKKSTAPFESTINSLIDYCSVFPVENGNSIRNKAMPFICQIFGHKYDEQYIKPLEGIETDVEQQLYRTAFEVLVDYILGYIQQKNDCWFDNNQDLHYDFLSSLCSRERPTNYQTNFFLEFSIIPNQEKKLCKKENLKILSGRETIPKGIQDKLFEIYNKLTGVSYKTRLVDEKYVWMLNFEEIHPKSIGREIEDVLKENNYSNAIIINIIDLFDEEEKEKKENKYWSSWFENIYSNKANIFLNRLQGEERNHTYTFMKTTPENKAKIAELLNNPEYDLIIDKSIEYIRNERDIQISNEYKFRVGKIIEDKLREKIKEELQFQYCKKGETIEVDDIQNGQDITICKNEKIIYYIEIKSKWNFNQPAHMSTNQMRRAVLNPNCYALCCVDLTAYSDSIEEKISEEIILENIYIHLDIGHRLGKFLNTIINDNSDEETNLKISNYQSNLNKGFFKKGKKGLSSLIDSIITKINNN